MEIKSYFNEYNIFCLIWKTKLYEKKYKDIPMEKMYEFFVKLILNLS